MGFKLKELTLKDSYGTLLGLVTVPARETHTQLLRLLRWGRMLLSVLSFFNQAKFEFFERHS